MSLCCFYLSVIEQFSRLLRSLDLGAVSQPPSPESNPYSPFPVVAKVGHYPTF